jgi:endonuclease YncB( thermonuclease family)
MRTFLLVLFALSCVTSAPAAEVIGIPTITDGDTIVITGKTIRLDAIDAPESDQICLNKSGEQSSCGIAARDALEKRFGGKEWTCQTNGRKTYERLLATCFVGQENINQWLVREGWAMSFIHYSHRYDSEEAVARSACAGLWAGSFHAPWDWRRRNCKTEIRGCFSVPIDAQEQLCGPRSVPPDPKCTIKATMRSGACIYHVEGGRYYGALKMSGGNKRWFCTETDAQAAGCRKSNR